MRFEQVVTLRDRLVKLWDASPPLKRGLVVGIPVVVLALAGTGIGFAAFHGGGSGASSALAHAAPTKSPTAAATPTPAPTETAASAGIQTPVPPPPGGAPPTTYRPVAPRTGSGPGSAHGTGMSISIPAARINAGVYSRTVGTNGVMGNPSGAWDVIWYDFSTFGAGVGGYPGAPGANAVFAGHVDYIHVGPAVFWNLKDLQPGAMVTVNTPNGPVNYRIQWSKWAGPDEDFGPYVAQNGQEMITLVTCIGDFSNGHYSNRLIVRGVRV